MHQRFFTAYEVAQHNSPFDCWVSLFHTVYDVTGLIKVKRCRCIDMDWNVNLQKCKSSEAKPLIENAGRDISHWWSLCL